MSRRWKSAFVIGLPLVLAGAAIVFAVRYYLIQLGPQRPAYLIVQDVSRSPRSVMARTNLAQLTEKHSIAPGLNLTVTSNSFRFKASGVECKYQPVFLGRRGVCDLWRFDFDGTSPPGKHSKTVKFCGEPVELWRSGSYAITLEPANPQE